MATEITNGGTPVPINNINTLTFKLITEKARPLPFPEGGGQKGLDVGLKMEMLSFNFTLRSNGKTAWAYFLDLRTLWKTKGTKKWQTKITFSPPDGSSEISFQGKIQQVIAPFTMGTDSNKVDITLELIIDNLSAQL